MINLIVQYFKIKYDNKNADERQKEILYCFQENLKKKYIDKIHWLYEDNQDLEYFQKQGIDINSNKIQLYQLGNRLKYSDIFNYCNKFLSQKICVYLPSLVRVQAALMAPLGAPFSNHDTRP